MIEAQRGSANAPLQTRKEMKMKKRKLSSKRKDDQERLLRNTRRTSTGDNDTNRAIVSDKQAKRLRAKMDQLVTLPSPANSNAFSCAELIADKLRAGLEQQRHRFRAGDTRPAEQG
jgi:hypothetical protein